jgi:hypothetical protein
VVVDIDQMLMIWELDADIVNRMLVWKADAVSYMATGCCLYGNWTLIL